MICMTHIDLYFFYFQLQVAQFDPLKGISLVTPGLFYYTITRRNVCAVVSDVLLRLISVHLAED